MRLQYQLSGLPECSSCGPDLQQDINAVAVFLEHVGDAFHLPSDASQPSEDLLLAWVVHHDDRNLCVLNPNTVGSIVSKSFSKAYAVDCGTQPQLRMCRNPCGYIAIVSERSPSRRSNSLLLAQPLRVYDDLHADPAQCKQPLPL
jgi:hypothetical protein